MDDDPTTSDHDDPDAYRTLAGPGTSEIKIEGSRFLGRAHPVDSEEQAELLVEEMGTKYHDARHVCYGLRVGHGASRIDRSNDDGEPARTGGFPIWQILSNDEIENTIVIVIRYFGGTKLGMGGLRRAYRDAARAAIDDAGFQIIHPETTLSVTIPYDLYDQFEDLIERLDAARIVDRQFTADVRVDLAIWESRQSAIRQRLGNFLGRAPDTLGTADGD